MAIYHVTYVVREVRDVTVEASCKYDAMAKFRALDESAIAAGKLFVVEDVQPVYLQLDGQEPMPCPRP